MTARSTTNKKLIITLFVSICFLLLRFDHCTISIEATTILLPLSRFPKITNNFLKTVKTYSAHPKFTNPGHCPELSWRFNTKKSVTVLEQNALACNHVVSILCSVCLPTATLRF